MKTEVVVTAQLNAYFYKNEAIQLIEILKEHKSKTKNERVFCEDTIKKFNKIIDFDISL